jgi:hypothetical protein
MRIKAHAFEILAGAKNLPCFTGKNSTFIGPSSSPDK